MRRCRILIPDAGPFNSLWVADALDVLLKNIWDQFQIEDEVDLNDSKFHLANTPCNVIINVITEFIMPKIQRIGNSHGVVLPSNVLAQGNISPGDHMIVAPVQDGIVMAAEGSATGRMVAGMLDSMDRFGETYRTLASERLSDER